ncbi:MAG: LDL receptor domain-containing protein [Myxococcota bacterium]
MGKGYEIGIAIGFAGICAVSGCTAQDASRGAGFGVGAPGADADECITPWGEPCAVPECEDPCDYNNPELLSGACVVTEAPGQCDDARGVVVTFQQAAGSVVVDPGGFFKPQDKKLRAWVQRRWRDVANYTVPSSVRAKLTTNGTKIWNYPDGVAKNGSDFFASIMTLPDGKTPQSLLRDMLNDIEGATGRGDFSEWVGWPRSNNRKLGDAVDLDIWGPDNGAVGYFRIASDEFCVITLENKSVGTHPVSGVRCWGWEPMTINPNWMNEAGCKWSWSKPAYMFYSIGIDAANLPSPGGWAGQKMQEGTWAAMMADLLKENDRKGGVSGRWVLYKTVTQPSKLKPKSGVAVNPPGQLNAWKIKLPSDKFREGESCANPDAPAGNCAANEFTCESGECISDALRCDGMPNCADGDDETACDGAPGEDACPGQWACGDGRCIPNAWRCDGSYEDCPDGEDETSCDGDAPSDAPDGPGEPGEPEEPGEPGEPEQCSADEFACNDGTCIVAAYECDAWVDCPDGEDENDCADAGDGGQTCGGFQCDNGECIPAYYECDGEVDCQGGEDEWSC